MSEYTPPTEQVREIYAEIRHECTGFGFGPHRAEFDRWLNKVKAEALADAGLLARPLPTRYEISEVILAESLFGSRTPIAAADAVLDLLKGQDR